MSGKLYVATILGYDGDKPIYGEMQEFMGVVETPTLEMGEYPNEPLLAFIPPIETSGEFTIEFAIEDGFEQNLLQQAERRLNNNGKKEN